MAWNSIGTVTVTNGSKTLLGVGTNWIKQASGWQVWIRGEERPHEIEEVVSSTELALVKPVERQAASGLDFVIVPTQGLNVIVRDKLDQVFAQLASAQEGWEAVVSNFSATTYQLWLDQGNSGTVVEFLDFLVGPRGPDGKSAYDVWIDQGNVGTEADFFDVLSQGAVAATAGNAATAQAAQSAAETAETGAEAARDITIAARDVTTAARDVTTAARDAAEAAETNAVAAQAATETARDATLAARDITTAARDMATTARDTVLASQAQVAADLAAVVQIFDTFDDRYLGAFETTSEPATDNDGDPLIVGAIYWNTDEGELRFWNSTAWESPEATASLAAQQALDARDLAADARDVTTAARDVTTAARDAAEIAETNAAAAQAATETARDATLAARDVTTAARDTTTMACDAVLASEAQVAADLAAVAQILDTFNDRYLGAFETADEPVTDNDGDPLIIGAIYWNIDESELRFWNSTAWKSPEATASLAAQQAIDARDETIAARDVTTAARDVATEARDQSQIAQTAAEAAQTAAEAAETEAQLHAQSASLSSNADRWVSEDAYVFGQLVWSPIDLQTYRSKTNHSGQVTDPSLDTTNWGLANAAGEGAMFKSTYDPENVAASVFDRANHTGTQAISTVFGLQTVLDSKAETSHSHSASDVTSGTFSDARIAESNVTQHEAALTLTEAQISDLGAYLTTVAIADISDWPTTVSASEVGYLNGVTSAIQSQIDGKQTVLSEGAFVDGDKTKLDGIELGANVTDTASVSAAGALMGSEVTNLAAVKAFDPADYATAIQGAKAETALQAIDLTGYWNQSNLSAVPQAEAEAGTATVDRVWSAERIKQAIQALAPASESVEIADIADWPSGLTVTELNYLSSVTSDVQSQINQRASITHSHTQSQVSGLTSALAAKQETSQKGAAYGYASLDADGLVPTSQLPEMSAPTMLGAVGSYAMLYNTSGIVLAPGDTIAGSALRYADIDTSVQTPVPPGTWRCMGFGGQFGFSTSIYVRIS